MPIFEVRLDSLDNRTREQVEITGRKMEDFTTMKRTTVRELKTKYKHPWEKQFYMTGNEEYPIHVILADSTYCKIQPKQTFKGRHEDPIVGGTIGPFIREKIRRVLNRTRTVPFIRSVPR